MQATNQFRNACLPRDLRTRAPAPCPTSDNAARVHVDDVTKADGLAPNATTMPRGTSNRSTFAAFHVRPGFCLVGIRPYSDTQDEEFRCPTQTPAAPTFDAASQ